MHPQTYLKTFWRLKLKPQIFVAMSFDPKYKTRFEEVICPAIRLLTINGKQLNPYRVDISKSGDSILTDISDGIAHSQLVLADISSIGKDSITGQSYRNSNVMYEIGIALACRQPSEVLLIRDDHDKFLFDVSTVPHLTLDFTDTHIAMQILMENLLARLHEQKYINDARIQIAISSLSSEETMLLKSYREYTSSTVWGHEVKIVTSWYAFAISRLLDKGIIMLAGEFPENKAAFKFTEFGYIIHKIVNSNLRKFKPEISSQEKPLPKTDDNGKQK